MIKKFFKWSGVIFFFGTYITMIIIVSQNDLFLNDQVKNDLATLKLTQADILKEFTAINTALEKPQTVINKTYVTNPIKERTIEKTVEKTVTTVGGTKLDIDTIIPSIVKVICPMSQGSGTIIQRMSDNNKMVLSNYHVFEGAGTYANCKIRDSTGAEYFLRDWGVILKERDIAELAFTTDIKTPALSRRCWISELKIGAHITAFGFPVVGGEDFNDVTVTDGIISGKISATRFRTTLKLSFGNSGGAAVLDNGCLAGIPTQVLQGELENYGIIEAVEEL